MSAVKNSDCPEAGGVRLFGSQGWSLVLSPGRYRLW